MQPAILLSLLLALVTPALAAEESLTELEIRGTLLRLEGDFDGARRVQDRLISEFDTPAGHVFALNTIVTHLTWDENQTRWDRELQHHADETLNWCQPILAENDDHAVANYYCGQAHFALSYFHGIRGGYYRAGRHGTRSIELLEQALASDPTLIDAKMHLGVAYFIADNLPPFIRMFSRLLWFIPTGNSEKSLPYIRDVMIEGEVYPDVARYIYSFLLLEGRDENLRQQARTQLKELVSRYPLNPRFQLRLISLMLIDGDFEATRSAATSFLAAASPPEPEASLTRIWQLRAEMGLGELEAARSTFETIKPVFVKARDEVPGWSTTWFLLTEAQLLDVEGNRTAAREKYQETLDFGKSTFVSEVVLDAARKGLRTPYQPGQTS